MKTFLGSMQYLNSEDNHAKLHNNQISFSVYSRVNWTSRINHPPLRPPHTKSIGTTIAMVNSSKMKGSRTYLEGNSGKGLSWEQTELHQINYIKTTSVLWARCYIKVVIPCLHLSVLLTFHSLCFLSFLSFSLSSFPCISFFFFLSFCLCLSVFSCFMVRCSQKFTSSLRFGFFSSHVNITKEKTFLWIFSTLTSKIIPHFTSLQYLPSWL